MWFSLMINQLDLIEVATFVALVSATWIFAGWLKVRGYLRIGDARKINHATVLAGGVAWFNSGDPFKDRVSCHLAVFILFILLLMVCYWRNTWLFGYAFAGYARESDRPHDAFHVWFSWIVSIIGLEIVDVGFGSLAITRCAALILGLADAVGEPIGTRLGKHRYFVRDIRTHNLRQRSWEGSLAVGITASLIVFLSVSPISFLEHEPTEVPVALAYVLIALLTGVLVALVEAWTPHGLDNLTIPIIAAVILHITLSNSAMEHPGTNATLWKWESVQSEIVRQDLK